MSRHRWRLIILGFVFIITECVPPPDVPTRPLELLARVELQINNTATQADDYVVTTTATPARIRLLNPADPPVSVPVTLKNLDFQSQPSLAFAATGPATSATLDLTLPGDGSWVPFVVAGIAGELSARDKDAVIEVLELRPDGIVLGRKALMVTTATPVPATSPPVEIQFGRPETIDDYLAWRPVSVSIRLATGAVSDVAVTVRNMTPVTAGRLVFGPTPALDVNVQPPPLSSTLAITLPANGEWVQVFVAGVFGQPSRNDKDAVLEVVRASDGVLLGREGVMVRIRKNANGLTVNERDRFVNAVARLNIALGNYEVYDQIHVGAAATGIAPGHSGPAFLAWHRAYILRYERELQAIDPAVALHYWRFDQAAPQVFDPAFMGGPPDAAGNASFAASNPLAAWTIEGFTGILRCPSFAPTASPTTQAVITETATFALGATYTAFSGMENNPHGRAHVVTGRQWCVGWVGFVDIAVRDPLFFLLHSNVERLWAKWQNTPARQDPAAISGYDPQGPYPGVTSTFRLGHYADDRMWPWDGRTGLVVPGDPNTQRPGTAPGGPIPAAIGGWGPPTSPRPRDVIDYDRWVLLTPSGLGYGYDDVPFIF